MTELKVGASVPPQSEEGLLLEILERLDRIELLLKESRRRKSKGSSFPVDKVEHVRAFVESHKDLLAPPKVPKAEVRDAYFDWCMEHQYHPLSNKALIPILRHIKPLDNQGKMKAPDGTYQKCYRWV